MLNEKLIFFLTFSSLLDNDEIFKGSHSSNFYSNRNSNDDDDDYKRSSITNTAKSRHRSRGRAQYRGTPATTTSTTFKPPVVQNYTTLTPFTTKSTTQSPFKFTFSSTVRANAPLSHVANQINSTPLGPLQQQYQHSNYNNNNFNSFKIQPTTTSVPISSTQKNNFRSNSFNNLVTTQPSAFNVPQSRQVVSVPTPFNSNHLNVKKFEGTNTNDKPITNSGAFVNSVIYNNNNNNVYNANASNISRQGNGRVFDNHNIINNYQTTSPFGNQRTVANHLPPNNTVLRLAPNPANSFAGPQNSAFNVQKPLNGSFYQPNQHLITTVQTPTTTQSRNSPPHNRPNYNQQDLINQFNSEQRKFSQQNQSPSNQNVQSKSQPDAQAYLSLEQKRLQLHYDINDYLTTDKYTSKYSPTSEQYRSVQSLSNLQNSPQASPSNQVFTQKYQDPLFTTTPKINKQPFEINYKQQYQTQQDKPSQVSNHQLNFNSQINTTPQPVIPKQTSVNNNNFISTSTKKFSTLVPKENYAPTTFKPLFYFNVAKQINDNLSTPIKPKSVTDSLITTSTARTNHIDPIFNRNPNLTQFNYRENASNKQQQQHPQQQHQKQQQQQQSQHQQSLVQTFKPVNTNASQIDENDGQYHPELYEKDFARYKIKNRKKQQQVIQGSLKQNFAKPQNSFNNQNQQQQQNINRGGQKSFGNSAEEEFLNTAHSQNIAASGNELWAHSKNLAKSKQAYSIPSKAPTIAPVKHTPTNENSSISKDDKDVSYDYAYYDSANDTPHDYSEFDLPDFGKTRN